MALRDSLTRASGRSPLAREIAEKFRLSPEFVDAYLDMGQVAADKLGGSYDAFWGSLNPLQQMYIGFALTTTTRGIEVQSLLQPYLKAGGSRRYLDVGCGYGGFLRAFAGAGFEPVGIEITPSLAALSRANVRDIAQAKVIEGDFLTLPTGSLGTFDCITCNDVIEHVADPPDAMRAMASMLDPGGVLAMEIPNRDFIGFVAKDGHYQLHAITTLPREEAVRYHEILVRPVAQTVYRDEMGDYMPFEYYENNLRAHGLECTLLERHVDGTPETLHALLADLAQAHRQWVDEVRPRLPMLLVREIETRYARYCGRLYEDIARLHETADVAAFRRRYLMSFWTLLARRP